MQSHPRSQEESSSQRHERSLKYADPLDRSTYMYTEIRQAGACRLDGCFAQASRSERVFGCEIQGGLTKGYANGEGEGGGRG